MPDVDANFGVSLVLDFSTVASSNAQARPNGCDALIGRFEWARVPNIPLVQNFALIIWRKLLLRLRDRFSQKILKDEALIWHRDREISSCSDARVFEARMLMV